MDSYKEYWKEGRRKNKGEFILLLLVSLVLDSVSPHWTTYLRRISGRPWRTELSGRHIRLHLEFLGISEPGQFRMTVSNIWQWLINLEIIKTKSDQWPIQVVNASVTKGGSSLALEYSNFFFIVIKICFVPWNFSYLLLLHLFVNYSVLCFSKPDLQSSHIFWRRF